MISGTHTVEIGTSPEFLWKYLADFSNWAEFVVGFQKFQIVDERTSVWTLRGDVGVLAREVDLQVVLLEQEPGRRASYSTTGITERLEGTGTFEISPRSAAGPQTPGAGDHGAEAPSSV
jgi:carbon monoxide dehydrogenase subunit G